MLIDSPCPSWSGGVLHFISPYLLIISYRSSKVQKVAGKAIEEVEEEDVL